MKKFLKEFLIIGGLFLFVVFAVYYVMWRIDNYVADIKNNGGIKKELQEIWEGK